jgi:hypothetical protein
VTQPSQRPEKNPPDRQKPVGPRTPYPVDHPGIRDQPGSEPDYIPATPGVELPKM